MQEWWSPSNSNLSAPANNAGVASSSVMKSGNWVRGMWGTEEDLPMWLNDASQTNTWVINSSGVISPPQWNLELSNNYFVAGLSDQAWMEETPQNSTAWFMIDDLLTEAASAQMGGLSIQLQVRDSFCTCFVLICVIKTIMMECTNRDPCLWALGSRLLLSLKRTTCGIKL